MTPMRSAEKVADLRQRGNARDLYGTIGTKYRWQQWTLLHIFLAKIHPPVFVTVRDNGPMKVVRIHRRHAH